MPKFQTVMDDGSTYEGEFSSGDEAKRAHRNEARQKSGATARTDPRIKVKHVINLDLQRGPTDPRGPEGRS